MRSLLSAPVGSIPERPELTSHRDLGDLDMDPASNARPSAFSQAVFLPRERCHGVSVSFSVAFVAFALVFLDSSRR